MTATPQTWDEVMAGLRGARLAVYDDVLGCGPAGRSVVAASEVLAWLESHGLLVQEAGGLWRARSVERARAWWEPSHGAAVVNGAGRSEGAPLPVSAGQLALF